MNQIEFKGEHRFIKFHFIWNHFQQDDLDK